MWSFIFKLGRSYISEENKGQRLQRVYEASQIESPTYYVPILVLRPPSGDPLTLY